MSRALIKDSLSILNDRFLDIREKIMGSFCYAEPIHVWIRAIGDDQCERRTYPHIEPLYAQIISWKTKILNSIFYLGSHRHKFLLNFSITPHKNRTDFFHTAIRQVKRIPKLKSQSSAEWQRFNGGKPADRSLGKRRQVDDRIRNTRRKRNKTVKDQKTSILVAADSRDMNDRIYQFLASDYEVLCANDGREAYETVVRENPHVVIVDVLMPLMNGCDLLTLIKGNRDLKKTSVILLTSHMDDTLVQENVFGEADEFLIKPFSRTELLTRVKTQVELLKSRQMIKEQEIQLTRRSIEQKDRFISIAGHELKTPLTSLQAYTELLAEKASRLDKDTLQKYLDKSKTFVWRLNRLVTELLDVSRIKGGKMEYRFRDFNFREMVEENVEMIRSFASGHNFRIEGDLPVVLHGDRERLEQVMQNLLSNAVRYSPNGGTITVYCRRSNGSIIVSVKDEGLGISDAEKRKIFDSYNRASKRHQISGLGLGLFICATIVERHGGKIWLESKVDKGSVFYFSLPQQIKRT